MWARNVLVTFLLSGLWHGASWNYVLWGLYHGAAARHARAAGASRCRAAAAAARLRGAGSRSPQIAGMFVLTN